MKFQCQKNRGKLDINWDQVALYAHKFKDGTRFAVEISVQRRTKSDSMRKYYFAAVIAPFREKEGYDPDETIFFHTQLKFRYFEHHFKLLEKIGLPKPYLDKRGIPRKVPHVFSNNSPMPNIEKAKFIEWVIRKAVMAGVYIEEKK